MSPALQFFCDNQRHLVCMPYSIANLHQMATELNIHRGWFHAGDKPHYDIPKRRIAEVQAQCQLVSPRRVLEIIRQGQELARQQGDASWHDKAKDSVWGALSQ